MLKQETTEINPKQFGWFGRRAKTIEHRKSLIAARITEAPKRGFRASAMLDGLDAWDNNPNRLLIDAEAEVAKLFAVTGIDDLKQVTLTETTLDLRAVKAVTVETRPEGSSGSSPGKYLIAGALMGGVGGAVVGGVVDEVLGGDDSTQYLLNAQFHLENGALVELDVVNVSLMNSDSVLDDVLDDSPEAKCSKAIAAGVSFLEEHLGNRIGT